MSEESESSGLQITSFQVVELRVRNVGPFRADEGETIEITTEGDLEPANFFMLASPNGAGKTTLLECLAWLYALLFDPDATADWLADAPKRDMELDILVEAKFSGVSQRVLLVVVDVRTGSFVKASRDEERARWGFSEVVLTGRVGDAPVPDQPLVEAIRREARALNKLDPAGEPLHPDTRLPTLLYFTSQRDLLPLDQPGERAITRPPLWPYRPVHRFGAERTWGASLDGVLTWLYWLEGERPDSRFRRAVDLVNNTLFNGTPKFIDQVDRPGLAAQVRVAGGQVHRLDQLSSGEKNLVQMLLRIALHMTRFTLIVVDELDLHLHPHLERRAVTALHRLVMGELHGQPPDGGPDISVMFTSHSTDSMKEFDIYRALGDARVAGGLLSGPFAHPTVEQ